MLTRNDAVPVYLSFVRIQRKLRSSEAAFIFLAFIVGIGSGTATIIQQLIADEVQSLIYGTSINRLSELGSVIHPWRLVSLPIGGAALVLLSRWLARRRAPVDVVEANALHGGRIPFIDNLVISAETLLSNGVGASVGLEAAYAQMGGGLASQIGQWFKLRRNDLRTLVGAGAGAAIGAAFGAPMAGAFYAFEIVIGNYTPAAIAPVMAAALAAVSVPRALGIEPYLIVTSVGREYALSDYLAFAGLAVVCAGIGIATMRIVTFAEQSLQRYKAIAGWRPVVGGLLLVPLALMSPQTLSAGHGAMHLDLTFRPALWFLAMILGLKITASVVSLSFGFRGGLFFASLFLGSLVGQLFAGVLNAVDLGVRLDPGDAALVGMAAFSVSVVGGPMTLAVLMLEITHDFELMGVVLTAALLSSALTREMFGYSFSTWRLHVRGSAVRSPRDIGWMHDLNAGALMRHDWIAVSADANLAAYRERVPLGSTKKAVITDAHGLYRGIVTTDAAFGSDLDPGTSIDTLAILSDTWISLSTGVRDILLIFDQKGVDEIAVVDRSRRVLGIVSEKYARRRYFERIELAQRNMFGER